MSHLLTWKSIKYYHGSSWMVVVLQDAAVTLLILCKISNLQCGKNKCSYSLIARQEQGRCKTVAHLNSSLEIPRFDSQPACLFARQNSSSKPLNGDEHMTVYLNTYVLLSPNNDSSGKVISYLQRWFVCSSMGTKPGKSGQAKTDRQLTHSQFV